MEGIGNQRRCTLTLLLLMLMSTGVLTIQQQCPAWDWETEEGICCNKCSPGFKLLEKCLGENLRSKCVPCNDGEFSDQMNFSPNCRRCIKCKASRNEYEVSPCQKEKNTICRCKDGYYKYNIDTETYECRKCKKCGVDEIEKHLCTHEKNTECACKENYYREKGKCEPCSRCTPGCANCSISAETKGPESHHPQLINMIAGAVAVVFVLLVFGILITYMATKWVFKKKMQSQFSSPSVQSKEPSKDFLISISESSEEISLKAAPAETPLSEQLPDCVPMIPDLLYAVLDLVPVHQMKQLVRSLGVTDTEIEQVEMDHRFCREAHYQMLRMWAQRGSRTVGRGQGETVHQPLLEELLDKLRQLHLSQAAEELETKYSIQ